MTRRVGRPWARSGAAASRQSWPGITRLRNSWRPIDGCSVIRCQARSVPSAERLMTPAYRIDPLTDPRWAEFVERHPRASVFHTPGWLEALRRTYGYDPVAYTMTRPGACLTNGVVLCRVSSRITGRRLVSLPFSDHCEPLVDRPEDLESLLVSLKLESGKEGLRYIEIRPRTMAPLGMDKGRAFYLHSIDLNPALEEIFRRFHKDCTRRKIRRAEREGLTHEEGRSETILEQ